MNVKGKGGKIRNVDIPPDLSMLLKLYVKEQKLSKKDRLFPIDPSQVWRITKAIADIHPHGFRHSYAIVLLRSTGNIRYVQKQLGHDSMRTTEKYLQFVEYDQEKSKLPNLYATS